MKQQMKNLKKLILLIIAAAVCVLISPSYGGVLERGPAIEKESEVVEKTLGERIIEFAEKWVGVTPYVSWYNRRYNGEIHNSLQKGTDCSGFVSLIYQQFDIDLPLASDQYQNMSNTDYQSLEVGDIVVYRYGGHIALYAGNDEIIHCANPEKGTVKQDMWYATPTGYVHIQEEEVVKDD